MSPTTEGEGDHDASPTTTNRRDLPDRPRYGMVQFLGQVRMPMRPEG